MVCQIAISVCDCQLDVFLNIMSLVLVIFEEHGVLSAFPLGVDCCNVLLAMVPFDVFLYQARFAC